MSQEVIDLLKKSMARIMSQEVVNILNAARSMELFAVRQYMQQHYLLTPEHQKLVKKLRKIAITEMEHCEALAERVVELGGDPTSKIAQEIIHGQSLDEIWRFDAKLEADTIVKYNEFLDELRQLNDHVSYTLLNLIVDDEHEHLQFFHNQITS